MSILGSYRRYQELSVIFLKVSLTKIAMRYSLLSLILDTIDFERSPTYDSDHFFIAHIFIEKLEKYDITKVFFY